MNNNENYKKAVDQIHASDELKEKTIQNIKRKKVETKVTYLQLLSACAVFFLILGAGKVYYDKIEEPVQMAKTPHVEHVITQVKEPVKMSALNKDLPRFESLEQMIEVIKENNGDVYYDSGVMLENAVEDLAMPATTGTADVARKESSNAKKIDSGDHSTTNIQVENVDEADIVKTDGKYIYYITQSIAYIIKADDLKIVSELEYRNEKERFNPNELYINGDKLILIGSYSSFDEKVEESARSNYSNRIYREYMTEALVLDVSDKENPKEVRTVKLDGGYRNSRMIGNNVYMISSKSAGYYDGMKEENILPVVYDSLTGEAKIEATDIAYFPETDSYSIMTVAGFDINNEQGVCTETFYGASDIVYASEKNLYITQIDYGQNWKDASNVIYKFKLDGSKIELLCKGEVKGSLNNQFSMDEYDGNLRIATTSGYDDKAVNQLFVLDENLKEIGKISNMAPGERIYSVRFIGKVGYIVTFEQVDPLFVIDLSNPRNPEVKGELKIPGYSSYLHPYDETHIIGIGYNTKPNGYGGVTNSNMKMSMFDVSDLSNPTEMFHVDIGGTSAYSEILYNHKALFEHKGKDLIGFPVTLREYQAKDDKDALVIFHVDLEKGFERYGEITHDIDWRTNIDRAIYIGDTLYTLAEYQIKSYKLDDLTELKTLDIEEVEDPEYQSKLMYTEDVMEVDVVN